MNAELPPPPVCDFCGLPVPKPIIVRRSNTASEGPSYCCSGCRFAATVVGSGCEEENVHGTLLRLGFAAFCTMNVLAFSMALWGNDVYGSHASDATQLASAINALFRYATLIFALPVLVLLGGPMLAGCWLACRRGVVTADVLVLLGVIGAYTYSVVSVLRGEGSIYFEVGCVVLAFLTLGRWFEATGKLKMGEALDELAKLLPNSVHAVRGDAVEDVPRTQVKVGDVVRVLAGERIPVDGQIVAGAAEIDEQVVTGEGRTVSKSSGARVFGGTLNLDGDLRVRVTSAAGEETISRIQDLVREACRTPGRYQRLADRIASWFVPLTACIALATAVYRGSANGIDVGVLSGLAVVLIACPCAFALATPMAVWTAMGRAARGHVLFRSGLSLERLAHTDVVYFDKTGTLTTGSAEVDTLIVSNSSDRREALGIAAALATASNHSFSLAIRRYAAGPLQFPLCEHVRTISGKGLLANVQLDGGSSEAVLGSRRLIDELGMTIPECILRAAEACGNDRSLVYVGFRGQAQAVFVLREQIRAEAWTAIDECREMGLQTAILTGDNASRANRLAQALNTAVSAEALPEDKASAVQTARRKGQRVTMVGDGINDAPALAAADVGVAMGCGADLSRDSASVCLLSNDLLQLPWAIALARRTVQIIRQNLFWAFVYNVVGIGLAVSGRLNPIWAGAAMVLSSLFVVTNSLRLNRFPEQDLVVTAASNGGSQRPALRKQLYSPEFDHELQAVS